MQLSEMQHSEIPLTSTSKYFSDFAIGSKMCSNIMPDHSLMLNLSEFQHSSKDQSFTREDIA